MSVRTTCAQRQEFYRLHQAGSTYAEIAERFGVSRECVRYWCRKQRDGHGCETQYQHFPQGHLSRFHDLVRYSILRLKLEHQRWGPSRIRAQLQKRSSLRGLDLPSTASIGRYLHQWPRFRRKRKQKSKRRRYPSPTHVHEVWQIDFKVGIRLTNGLRVNLHTVRDPFGAAYIGDFVFATGNRQRRVTLDEVRAVLRQCFARWHTLPDSIQTDGEPVLVSLHSQQQPFPSAFTLWLTGLGIEHRIIRHVTQNAEVERCHRTVCDYALVGNEDQQPAALQTILDHALHELNFELPSQARDCHGQPPVLAHPELLTPRRPYQPEHELALFDLQRVNAYLATLTWQRTVDHNGVVQLGGKASRYTIGRAYARHCVTVRFDPSDRHFVFFDNPESEQPICRCPAKRLEIEDLTGLNSWPTGLGPQQLPLPLIFQGVHVNEQLGV